MKKMLLLSLAALCALACAELIVARIIGYPTYGVEYKMLGIRGLDRPVNIFKPYSKYWTVEGGNKVYRRNNLGFSGMDAQIEKGKKYIFVLGSSFVEAYQVPPDKIAASIFQSKLDKHFPDYQVLNLSNSGHDPYDMYWRLSYFEKKFAPALIILVIDQSAEGWLKRHPRQLNFDLGLKKPRVIHSVKLDLAISIRNHSAFLNLVSEFLRDRTPFREEESIDGPKNIKTANNVNSELTACIEGFNNKYPNRFCLVSNTEVFNSYPHLREYCNENGILFLSGEFYLPKYRINGTGHLNRNGNKLLGELLYDSFLQFKKK